MRKLALLVSVLVLSVFGLAACGGDDDEEAATAPATETAPADGGEEAVSVSADPGGSLAFQQESLEAPAGSVTFEFDNPASTTHDFCIEQDGQDVGCTDQIAQSTTELTADLQPGNYTFYCSVAGHREGGMEGELTVE